MEFNKRDILNALGLETEINFWTVALAGFGVGCLVGAAVAIMVAPKSGRELRSDIMDKGRDLIGRGKDEMANLGVGMGNKMPDDPDVLSSQDQSNREIERSGRTNHCLVLLDLVDLPVASSGIGYA